MAEVGEITDTQTACPDILVGRFGQQDGFLGDELHVLKELGFGVEDGEAAADGAGVQLFPGEVVFQQVVGVAHEGEVEPLHGLGVGRGDIEGDVVPAAYDTAVFHGIAQIHKEVFPCGAIVVIIGIRSKIKILVEGPVVDDNLVEGDGLCDVVGGGQLPLGAVAAVVGSEGGAVEGNGGHLIGIGDPALQTHHVIGETDDEKGHAEREDAGGAPALAEDLEGLLDKHFGHQTADDPGKETAEGEEDLGGVKDGAEGVVEHIAAAEGGAEGEAELEDGFGPGEGDDVSCRLHVTGLVKPEGDKDHHHRHAAVDQNVLAAGEDAKLGVVCVIGGAPAQVVDELGEGGEPLHQGVGPENGVVAKDEEVHHHVQQGGDDVGQHIENAVEHGHGHQMAGEHAAEDGEGVEEKGGAALNEKPQYDVPAVQDACRRFGHKGEKGDEQVGHHEEGKAGEVVGEEEAFPLDGQGVHKPGGAVIEEVGEHGDGGDQTENGREGNAHITE